MLGSSIQRLSKAKPNFHIWVSMQNLMFLTCLDGPKVRFSELHFSTARGTNSRHVAAYHTECYQTYHSAKVTCFIGQYHQKLVKLFLKFYWLSHRLMSHGSTGHKYWPMTYVTHADMLTHLTHDPWLTDPLSALLCIRHSTHWRDVLSMATLLWVAYANERTNEQKLRRPVSRHKCMPLALSTPR